MENRNPNPIKTAIEQAFLLGVLLGAVLMFVVLLFCGWSAPAPGQGFGITPSDYIRVEHDWNAPHLWLA